MTVTFALTPEQEQLLSQAAQLQGVDADRLLHHLVDGALDQLASPPRRPPCASPACTPVNIPSAMTLTRRCPTTSGWEPTDA